MAFVIAHRGASYCAPENTRAAYRKAMELGADGIETDIQLTADGQLVMHHNYTLANGKAICNMTLAELKQFDFGNGESIVTLAECLDAAKDMNIINLEMKAPIDRAIPFEKLVVDAVLESGLSSKIIISAFDHGLIRTVKTLCPELRVAALTMPPMRGMTALAKAVQSAMPQDVPLAQLSCSDMNLSALEPIFREMGMMAANKEALMNEVIHSMVGMYPHSSMAEILETAEKQDDLFTYVTSLDFPLDYLHPDYHSLLADLTLVSRLAERGIGVSSYTPDKPEEWKALLGMGCYGIITNRPDLLMQLKSDR